MMTQVSENKQLNSVFCGLFSAEGSEIYLKPAEDYILCGQPVSFILSLRPHAEEMRLPSVTACMRSQKMKHIILAYI